MYPGMLHWWKSARRGSDCGSAWAGEWASGCSPMQGGGAGWRYQASGDGGPDFGGASFGVRRPLRFLAWKLDLNDQQVAELAKILDQLKTERAQAAVDSRRTLTAFADALGGEQFDEGKVNEGTALRVQSAERLKEAVSGALRRIHALLRPDQREKLAYLIRTGTVTL